MGSRFSDMRKGLASFSPYARAWGASFWVAWITIVYSGDTFVGPAEEGYAHASLMFSVSTLALAVTLVAAGCVPKFVQGVVNRRGALLAASVVGSAATVVASFAERVPTPAFWLCAALTGCATALLALRIAVVLAEIDTKHCIMTMCCSIVLGLFVYSFSSMLALHYEGAALAVCALSLPLAAFVLHLDDEASEHRAVAPSYVPQSFRRLLACVFVIAFSLCSIRGYYPNSLGVEGFSAARGLVAASLVVCFGAILCVTAAVPRRASFGSLCYTLLLICAVSAVLIPVLGMGSRASGVLGDTLFGVMMMSVWALLARVSHRSGASVIRVFGFGFGVACLGTTAGFLFGSTVYSMGPRIDPLSVSLLLVAACTLMAVFLLRRSDLEKLMQPLEEAPSVERDDAAPPADDREAAIVVPRFRLRCADIASSFGLSARETEVFVLLAHGKDAKAVSEELFISFNTARTHIRNVYAKLDVHSRHDLLKLVEEWPEA